MTRAIYEVTRRHVLERPGRAVLTVIGITLGVAVAVAIATANVHVLASFERTVLSVAGQATIQISAGEWGMDERIVDVLRRHPHVRSATPVLQVSGVVAEGRNVSRLVRILAFDLFDADLKPIRFGAGAAAPSLETLLAPAMIFVGHRMAAEWSLAVGDSLDVRAPGGIRRVTIGGVLLANPERPTVWDGIAVMDIAAAQALFDAVGRVDRFDLVTERGRPIDPIIAELQAMLPVGLTVARPSSRNQQIERMVRAFQLNLAVLSAVSLLIGLFLVYNTVSFAVVQRRREIGILAVMGLSRRGITLTFMTEAAVMGLLGGLLGSLSGIVLARTLVSRLAGTISDLYESVDQTVLSGSWLAFVQDVPLSTWGVGLMLGIGVSIVGGLVPSLDASRTAPARALMPGDYEASQRFRATYLACIGLLGLLAAGLLALLGPLGDLPVFGYASALCLLLGLSCMIPLLLKHFGRLMVTSASLTPWWRTNPSLLARLAADQIARTPGRSAVTISAMMIGIAIMVGIGTMIGSFRETVHLWIEQTIIADLIVAPATWLQDHESGQLANRLPIAWAPRLARLEGVDAVDTYRDVSVEYEGHRVSLVSRDLRLHAERSRYLLTAGDSAEILQRAVREQGVLVSEVFARSHGVDIGSSIHLLSPSGGQTFQVLGVFYDYATDGGKIVMDRDLYRRLWRDETVTVFPLYLAPQADPLKLRRAIEAQLGAASGTGELPAQAVVIANGELKGEVMAIFDRTFTVTYALELIAIVIAVLGIVNTLVTSVLQRRREFALLRSMGTNRAHIRRLMLWESGYLGLLGATLGVLGGLLLSILLIAVINKQSFGWTIGFALQPWVLVQAVALAAVAALVAGYVPARWAARQPITDGLRYE